MIIIHGDNLLQSRSKLAELITQAKLANKQIKRLEAKNLELKDLELNLNSPNLFDTTELIILEGLHSLPTSKRKKELIAYLDKQNNSENLLLYEQRLLTTTMLKKFAQAQVFSFKTSNKLFSFLDQLGSSDKAKLINLLQEVLISDGEFMLFSMLARQIRLLIQSKTGGKIKGAPFMISKLKSQANKFSLEQLLKLHRELFELDLKQKTSKNILALGSELELLLLNM